MCSVKGCEGKHYAKGLCYKHYSRVCYQRPEVKEWHRVYQQRPEVKERQRVYQQRPEVKERRREYFRVYFARHPEYAARHNKHLSFKATERALVNARNFLSEESAQAFVLDGVLLEKRLKKVSAENPKVGKRGLIESKANQV